MEAFSIEATVAKGQDHMNELFNYVQSHAKADESYPIEKHILTILMKIGLSAMECYFATKGTGDVGADLQLKNGTTLKRQSGFCNKTYFSIFGKIKIPRTSYWKKDEEMIMPLDAQANIPKNSYSYLLQDWMNHLCIKNSFKESSESLEKLLGLKIYANRIEDICQNSCMSYDQFYSVKEQPNQESEGDIHVLGFDGIGVPMIKKEVAKFNGRLGKGEKRQKKKEAMVGVNYTIDPKQRKPEEVAQKLVYPEEIKVKTKKTDIQAKNIRRIASIERSRREVITELVEDAKQRDTEHKKPWIIVMDGALNLWDIIISVLKGIDYVGVLDIIHVIEYLWKVANILHGEKTIKGRNCVHSYLLKILQGNVDFVINELKQMLKNQKLKKNQKETIKKAVTYFENHKEWMKYDYYLEMGYPIGSGVVESSCGHTVKDRMEGTGRRWSIEGAEAILLLRSVYTSKDWETYWEFHMMLERSFNYHDSLVSLGIADDYYDLGIKYAA